MACLADMVNRRKLLCFMNLWLAGAAVSLTLLGSFQLLNPYVLLLCVFLIGVGFAFHAPAWSAIVPDLVTDEELPSAATLGGLQLSGDLRPVAVERVRSGIRVAIGKFPRIILYRRPICPIFPGDSSGTSPERPICFFYFCLAGADTRHRAEGTSTSTL